MPEIKTREEQVVMPVLTLVLVPMPVQVPTLELELELTAGMERKQFCSDARSS